MSGKMGLFPHFIDIPSGNEWEYGGNDFIDEKSDGKMAGNASGNVFFEPINEGR